MALAHTSITLPDGRKLPYTIRASARAKYLRLYLSAEKGLVVTQPAGVSTRQLQQWVNSQAGWIADHLPTLEKQAKAHKTDLSLPARIELTAIGETLSVAYSPTHSNRISIKLTDSNNLQLAGAVDDTDFCRSTLQNWLKDYARYHLGRLLVQAAQETGLTYTNYRVKGQTSRWGSCSSHGNINLNYKLMLLPAAWVRYTLIHELCHTVELNHSRRFWALVEQFVPEYKTIHAQMKGAMLKLPGWVNTS